MSSITKAIFFSFSFLFYTLNLSAQVLINGASMHTYPNAQIIILTDSLLIEQEGYLFQEGTLIIDKDAVVNNGILENDGIIEINENLINNDSLIGLNNTAQYFVRGNWTNNSLFNAGQSIVVLDGNVQQINGTQISKFYNLRTLGSLADVKQLVGINAEISNSLDLTDVEFSTDNQMLFVLNPSINAISRNNGFVSSLGNGKLQRNTNSTNVYLFPTGSSLGTTRYRPIEITPNTNDSTAYGVRLANVDATSEGYDVMRLNDSLCAVNPNFYHRIYGSETADIKMFYIPTDDGEWNAMANWQNVPEWQKIPNETGTTGTSFEEIEIPNWNNFTEPAYALGLSNPTVDLGPTQEIDLGDLTNLMANYSGPNPQQIIWTPIDLVDCFNCLETVAEPAENTVFNIELSINEHCIVTDSVLVIVNPGQLHLPTGFSPNSDGVNDIFRPMNIDLSKYEITIWNRWGEMVFQSDDYKKGWDGTYKGESAPLGVYTYTVEFQFTGRNELLTKKGNLTLLR